MKIEMTITVVTPVRATTARSISKSEKKERKTLSHSEHPAREDTPAQSDREKRMRNMYASAGRAIAKTAITAPIPTVLFISDSDAPSVESEAETVEPTIGSDEPTTNLSDLADSESVLAAIALCIPIEKEIIIHTKPIRVTYAFLIYPEIAPARNFTPKESQTEKPSRAIDIGVKTSRQSLSVTAATALIPAALAAAPEVDAPLNSIAALIGESAFISALISARYAITPSIEGNKIAHSEAASARDIQVLTPFLEESPSHIDETTHPSTHRESIVARIKPRSDSCPDRASVSIDKIAVIPLRSATLFELIPSGKAF